MLRRKNPYCNETFRSPFHKNYWKSAALEVFDLRILAFAGLMLAFRIAIKMVRLPIGDQLNITFSYFFNALGSMVYGPVLAVVSAVFCDLFGHFLAPMGAFNPFYTLVEVSGSFIFALFLYKTKITATRIILSRFLVILVSNLVLTPIGMTLLVGKPLTVVYMVPRIIKNLALFPLEAFMLVLFISLMVPITNKLFTAIKHDIFFKKRHIVLITVLFLLSVICVLLFYFVYLPNKEALLSLFR